MLPSLIARRWVGRQTLRWHRHKAIHFSWLGPELLVCCLAHRGSTGVLSFAPELVGYLAPRDLHRLESVSPRIHHGVYHDLFVYSG